MLSNIFTFSRIRVFLHSSRQDAFSTHSRYFSYFYGAMVLWSYGPNSASPRTFEWVASKSVCVDGIVS